MTDARAVGSWDGYLTRVPDEQQLGDVPEVEDEAPAEKPREIVEDIGEPEFV